MTTRHKKLFAGKLIGVMVFFIGLTWGARGDELYGCLTVNQPPLIDGETNDACWQNAVWGTAFTVLGTINPAPDQTRFALCADKTNLYLYAVCHDRKAENIKAVHQEGDGQVWKDECVELFVDPGTGGNKTAHLTFNALGACDLMWNDDNGSSPTNTIKSMAKRISSGWQVEAAVPFKVLGVSTLQASDRWRFNLGREHRHIGEEKARYSTWAYIPKGGFFTPQCFYGLRPVDKHQIQSRQMIAPINPNDSLPKKNFLTENPAFDPDPNGKLKAWELAGQARWNEDPADYLGGKYIVTLAAEGDAVMQKAGPAAVSGADYELTVQARGLGGAKLEAHLVLLNKDGSQLETVHVISNLTETTETFTLKGRFPATADKLVKISLQRAGEQGALTLYSAAVKLQAPDFIIDAGNPDVLAPAAQPVDKPVPTAHIKWADPFAGRKLHAAIIMETVEREAIELAQRFEMDYDLITASYEGDMAPRGAYYAFKPDQIMNNFMGRGKKYDVIIVAANIARDEFADHILKCVEQGAGLVYINPNPRTGVLPSPASLRLQKILPAVKPLKDLQDHYILKTIPLEGLPIIKDEKTGIKGMGIGNYGKGKIVRLEYSTLGTAGLMPLTIYYAQPDSKENGRWWEYCYALLIRSMTWVAGYEPTACIERMTTKDNTIEIKLGGQTQGLQAEVLWTSKKAEATETPALEKPNGLKCVAYSRQAIAPEQTTLSIPVPQSISQYGGIHFCNVILRDSQGRATDFGAASLKLESPLRITGVETDKKFYHIGTTATVRVDLVSSNPGNFRVKSVLADAFGRVGWTETKAISVNAGKNSIALSAPISRVLLSNWTRLSIALQHEDGLTLESDTTEVYVLGADQARRNDLLLGVDSAIRIGGAEYLYPVGDALMNDLGADLTLSGTTGKSADVQARFGKLVSRCYIGSKIKFWSRPPKIVASNETRYACNVRNPCFSDPDNIAKAVAYALDRADHISHIDGIGTLMTDEGTIGGDYCYCALCRDGFKQYAQSIYITIEKANREWGTSFADWHDIQPSTLDEIHKSKAANFSLWVDYRFYMDQSSLNSYKTVRDAVVKAHPEMGADGAMPLGFTNPIWRRSPLSGENYYTWAREEYYICKYFGLVNMPAYKSFNKQAHFGTWFGYSSSMPTVNWYPWWFAFNQGDNLTWWTAFNWRNLALFSFRGSHTPRSLALKESCHDLLHGIGQITRGSAPVKRSVAFLYSPPSLYTACATKMVNNYHSAEFEFRNLVRCAGYEFDFIPDEGRRTKLQDYRVLVLPCILAMSAETQQAIIDFAEQAGTVLSGVAPGRWDDHGKPFEGGGLLENLLKRPNAQSLEIDDKTRITILPHGKGKLICLNCDPNFKQHRELIRDLLEKTGMENMATLKTKGEYETYSFQKGRCRYLGIIGIGKDGSVCGGPQAQSAPDSMTVQLKDKAHLYDVRARKYLGYSDRIATEAWPEKGLFYALFPYEIKGVKMQCGFDESRREFWYEAQLKVKGGDLEDQVLRVDVTAPDGTPVRLYSGNFWTQRGQLQMRVPMALNDQPGKWLVKVTDVVSGEAAEKTFVVKAQKP